MDSDGFCKICPGKCFWDKHANLPYIIIYSEKKKTKVFEELKKKYESAESELKSSE